MKAISLHQPWASAIVLGLKHYETRSWSTAYRGPLAIHAAKRIEGVLHMSPRFLGMLAMAGVKSPLSELPFGGIVAIAELVAVVRTDGMDGYLSDRELAWGNYSPGRFAWRLEKIQPISLVACRGYQRLWNWEEPGK